MMRHLTRLLIFLGILLLGLGAIYLIVTFMFLDFFVDLWWFDSLGYKGYFYLRLIYRYITFLGVTGIFFLIFFFNFLIASRFLGTTLSDEPDENSTSGNNRRRLIKMFQSGSMKVYTPLSLIFAIVIAAPFYEYWEKALLYIFGSSAGVKDPAFHIDISFYLFSFPIYKLVQNELLIAFLLLLVSIVILYWTENRLLSGKDQSIPRGAKRHIALLIILTMIIQIWGFIIYGLDLLYTNRHQPNFYGPGAVEMYVIFPFIVLSILFFIGTALSLVSYIRKGTGIKKLIVFFVFFLISLWGFNTSHISRMVEAWWVKPSQGVVERNFIENNIQATLSAYKLDKIKTMKYDIKEEPQIITNPDVRDNLRNIPVWDRELLDDVYREKQGIRPYFDFPSVDVDRYTVSGRYQQVYLAPREIVSDWAKNWPSRHMQYTHGYGLVMTPAVQGGDESMTWFVKDIPYTSDYGIEMNQSGIYYGFGKYNYAIVPNEIGEIDHSKYEDNIKVNYKGTGGVPLSFFRKLIFAIYFNRESKIFFTSETTKDSRILFRRNFQNAISLITPFFIMDSDPYIVTTRKGLFWIQDAYTISDKYPISQPYNPQFNYIRNSVKIVVDAYNGSIDYYISDTDDPIVKAYKKMYPGLLKPLNEMSVELRAHLRYPKDFFEVQLKIYAEYHQKNPEIFYNHEDIWEMPEIPKENQSVPMNPYYLTINLLNPEKQEFLLLSPMSPRGRNNLRALVVAGCDQANYGKLFIYSFPKGKQIFGPAQINTLIDQDAEIAQQLTLWDQAGSEVKRGRMIILPVGNFILYIQPVYLSSATRLKIPELKRLIVSQGDVVVMAPSLEEAFQKLEDKLKVRIERQKNRFPITDQVESKDDTLPELKPIPEKPEIAKPNILPTDKGMDQDTSNKATDSINEKAEIRE